MTRSRGGRLPTNGAATKGRGPRLPSVPPSRTRARTARRTRGPGPGADGGGDEQGPAGRAAGDSGVAGPRTGAPRLPAHQGPRLRRAAREPDLSRSGGRPPPQSGPGPARDPGPGVRAQPAPRAVPASRAARAPTLWRAPSPPHCPRLSRTCPGHPAPGSAGWPRTRCPPPSRRRGLGRRRSGPRAWGTSAAVARAAPPSAARRLLRARSAGAAPASPARPGPAHRGWGGGGEGWARLAAPGGWGEGPCRGGERSGGERRGGKGEGRGGVVASRWGGRWGRALPPEPAPRLGPVLVSECGHSLQILESSFWNTGQAILHLYRLGSAFNHCRDLLLKRRRAKAHDF